jgi:hypothetical protein
MGVYLNSITFKNPLDTTPINWLLANVGDEILIKLDISVKEFVLSSTQNSWILNNQDGYVTTGTSIWITGGDFSKFNQGDTIQIFNYVVGGAVLTTTIVEKLSNTEIRIASNVVGWSVGQTGTQDAISLVDPITALYYKWNFIENDEATNFYSKVDESVQVAQITGLNPAGGGLDLPMTFNGNPEYQIGYITVDEVSLTTTPVYSSNFKIKHFTRITPAMLYTQWDDMVSNLAPEYFLTTACLKYIFNIEARYNLADPNRIQFLENDTILGNTGWFNEKFNTGVTNYYLDNLVYKYNTNTVIPTVQLLSTNNTSFSFNIQNTTDNPFVSGSTKLVINFCKAPNDETEYINTGRDLKHNFVWDSALLTASLTPSPINGDGYSDLSLRSLANLKATIVSASEILIEGNFEFDQQGIDVFEESDEPRYMFWVSIQNHALIGANSDRVNVKVDFNKFYYQTAFPNLISFDESKLIPHFVNDYTTPFTEYVSKFAEDEIVGYNTISKTEEPLVTSFELTKFTARLIAVDSVSGNSFVLEQKSINLPNNLIAYGQQSFDLSVSMPYHVPSTEIRKNMIAQSVNVVIPNIVTETYYRFAYPFLVNWEYWNELLGADTYFFDSTKPFNNLNKDFHKYSKSSYSGGTWTVYYECDLSTKVNGLPASYTNRQSLKLYDRNLSPVDESASVINCTIDTSDSTGSPLIDGSGNKYILGYDYTVVKATFNRHFQFFNNTIVIGLEVWEQGGVKGKRRMSSAWASDSDTWFIPMPTQTTNTVLITQPNANTVIGRCVIDYNQIQGLVGNYKWKITARLYNDKQFITTNTDGYGYLGSQDVYMIAENPVDEETTVLDPKKLNCCSDLVWNVLASSTDADLLKNDSNSFLWWFNKDAISTAVLHLIKDNGTPIALTGSSIYGTAYDYGFYTNGSREKLVGYLIDWNKVIQVLGEGMYRVTCTSTTIFGGTNIQNSASYCLKEYTVERANNTVRIEYYLNGILGLNRFDDKFKDLGQLNWYNQHRFSGHFQYVKSDYKKDYIQYNNGERQFVEDEQEPEYSLSLKPIPMFKHDVLRTDILQADDVIITDYNYKNIDNYYQKNVQIASSYEPKWSALLTKLASVELKFKQKTNKLKKFRT